MRTLLLVACGALLIGSSGAYAQDATPCLERLRRENDLPDSRLRSLQPTDTLTLDGIPYPVSTVALGGGTAESVCVRHEPVRARIAQFEATATRAREELRGMTTQRDNLRGELRRERERTKWERLAPIGFYASTAAFVLMTFGFFMYAHSVSRRTKYGNKHHFR